jgi:hypothetical protein
VRHQAGQHHSLRMPLAAQDVANAMMVMASPSATVNQANEQRSSFQAVHTTFNAMRRRLMKVRAVEQGFALVYCGSTAAVPRYWLDRVHALEQH